MMIELGHVTDRKPPYRYAAYQRVGFSETDAQGVVYYGRYMPYFDVARTEYHRHLGRVHLGDVDFAMRAVNVEYVAGARFDDLLEIFVRVERIGTTSITYDHAAYRVDEDGDTLMATAKATVVCIALDVRKAVPVPDAFRRQIAALEGPRLNAATAGPSPGRGTRREST